MTTSDYSWLDETMAEFDIWCRCGHDECVKYDNFREAKQAITAKLEHYQVQHLSDLARAVGILDGLGHKDKYLADRYEAMLAALKHQGGDK